MNTGFGMFLERQGKDYFHLARRVLCVSFVRRNWGRFPKQIELQVLRGQGPFVEDLIVKCRTIDDQLRLWQCGEWCDVYVYLEHILRQLSPGTRSFFVTFRMFVNGETIKPKTHETQKNRNRARP